MLALTGVLITGGIGYYMVRLNNRPVSQGLRLALWSIIGGLVLYLAYALHLPGTVWLREQSGVWGAVWAALLGGMGPLVVVGVANQWRRLAWKIKDWRI
jgi:hypothetical protein